MNPRVDMRPWSLSVKAASKYFGLTAGTIYTYCGDGTLQRGVHFRKLGRKTLIMREAVEQWIVARDEEVQHERQSA